MHSRTFLKGLALTGLVLLSPGLAQAIVPKEKDKIEALIRFVENLKDSSFIRNGKTYDAADAAKFLRAKWNTKTDEVLTVDDFINKVATGSETTGKPYMIRFSDGHEMKCADYLRTLLDKVGG